MSLNSKGKVELGTENDKMPHTSKEKQDKATKQRQDARVNHLLNKRIPEFRRHVDAYAQIAQEQKDHWMHSINTSPNTDAEKADFMATSTKWQMISKLSSDSATIQLMLDHFESELRREWKVKKKESPERRDAYTKEKRMEFKTMRKRYLVGVRDDHKKMEKELPGVKNDVGTSDEEDWAIQGTLDTQSEGEKVQEQAVTSGEEVTDVEEEAETDEETDA
ncbi:hypothetical protein IQ06DRAFT_352596 [Phaeosphaeriaceae sp. SRC1lsM3a]|nr:hypothetical protein IQ06DRAFT_352596 [Stagonospora sp. SRC1lsM3a]